MRQRIRSTAISPTCASTIRGSCPGILGLPVSDAWNKRHKRQASLRKHLPGGAHADQGTRRADHSKDDQRDICHYPQTKNRNKPAFHIG